MDFFRRQKLKFPQFHRKEKNEKVILLGSITNLLVYFQYGRAWNSEEPISKNVMWLKIL